MRKLKLVFHVEDEDTKEIVVEKQQTRFDALSAEEFAERRAQEEADYQEAKKEWPKGQPITRAPPVPKPKHPFSVSTPELARDHLAEIEALLGDAAKANEMLEVDRAHVKAANAEKRYLDEVFMAVGDLTGRFVRLKLREWAQRERAKEPA